MLESVFPNLLSMSESPITILFTSAGRRVGLMNAFRTSIERQGESCRLLAADLEPEWSSACQVADDAFSVPRIGKGYAEAVLDLCREQSVDIVIPTLDPELEPFAEAQQLFEDAGVWLVVSSQEACSVFASKTRSAAFFESVGLATPAVLTSPNLDEGPLFAKRERSSSSVGATKVTSSAQLSFLKESDPDLMYQPFIEGTEFTIDLYLDRKGQLHDWVARRRVEVRAGEVSKAETCRDHDLADAVQALAPHLQHCQGPLTLQVIREADTGMIWYIEINPRFGGGFPLAFANGMDVPAYLEAERKGMPLPVPREHPPGMRMLRYDEQVVRHSVS